MLKVRLVPTLLHKNLGLVKGQRFDSSRRVGAPMQAIKVYNMREVDELVFLDISATADARRPDFALIDELADECFMPLTVGGGVHSLDDVRRLLMVGADKVALNTAAVETPDVIRKIADSFGSQCLVVSIDVKRNARGRYEVFIRSATKNTTLEPVELARKVAQLGAGEILLTSIDHDGMMDGYDLDVTKEVSDAVSIPVIASGGAGTYAHMEQALTDGGASAVAASSMFLFTEQTPLGAKKYLHQQGIHVRL